MDAEDSKEEGEKDILDTSMIANLFSSAPLASSAFHFSLQFPVLWTR
jgi:hypothetical protein